MSDYEIMREEIRRLHSVYRELRRELQIMSDYEIMREEIRRLHSVYRELRRELRRFLRRELAQKNLKISDLES